MEPFWFFRLRFRRAYDSAGDSDFWFSQRRKRSYDSDSVASENQPLQESLNKRKIQFSFSKSVRVRLRESANTEFDWEVKRGFKKASVIRAVRWRECPLAESWLYIYAKVLVVWSPVTS